MFSLNTSGLMFHLFYLILLFLKMLAASWYYKTLPCDVKLLGNDVIVKCTNRSLKAIPPQIPTNTTNLTLNINHIEEITPNSFSRFSNLVEIGLKCNCIPIKLGPKDIMCNHKLTIMDNSFASLHKLRSLFLDGNQLSKFPKGLPPHLQLLSLEANNIISIYKNNLYEIRNIEMLYLGQNCYYRNPCNVSFVIEKDIFKDLTQLTLLSLKGNNLSYVPGSFPVSLKELYIYNNRIESIKEYDFQNLTNLEVLDLSGNCPPCLNSIFPCIPCPNNAAISIHDFAFDSLKSLHTLRLKCNSLQRIPKRWFKNIHYLQVLDLSQNFLSNEIKEAEFLLYVPMLKSLDFSFNYILQQYQLDLQLSKTFSSLKSLETLRIRGYVFQELRKSNLEPLLNLKNLTVLDLGTNFIKVADFSLFQNFSSLKTIALTNNNISPAHNPTVSSCTNMKSSSAQYNYAPFRDVHYFDYDDNEHECKANLYDELRFQKSATEHCQAYGQMLDLSRNNIFFIRTSDFNDLSFIKCLNMSGNAISQALNGTEFASLKNLKYLDFSNNRIDLLHSNAFEELQELEILDLSYNQYYFLAEGITHMLNFTANLPHLKKLMMNWNEISTSSYEMVSKSIQTLEFKGNRLDILWMDGDTRYANIFKKLTALNILDISHNALTFIPSNVFEGLPANLSRLYVANNNFNSFSWKLLCHLEKLQVLDLSNNHLTTVPFEATNCTNSITKLILRNNKIKSITSNFLINAVSLRHLDLSYNRISLIGESSFSNNILPKVKMLLLQGNPFNCNCHLVWFVSWINSTNVIIPYLVPDVSCAGPGAHRGKSLIFLNLYTCERDHWNLVLFSCSSSLVICLLVVCTSSHLFYWDFWYTYQLLKVKLKGYRKLPKFCYDAFIVYDSTQYAVSDWIFNELIIHLEKEEENMFNLCLEGRDWMPGKPFLDNLSESIQLSRKTVFVLTDKYVTSGHFKTAFYIAHQRLIEEKIDVIIFILLEKTLQNSRYLRLRKRLCGNSVLYWPTNPNTHNYFWYCLKNALRRDSKLAYDRQFKDSI